MFLIDDNDWTVFVPLHHYNAIVINDTRALHGSYLIWQVYLYNYRAPILTTRQVRLINETARPIHMA